MRILAKVLEKLNCSGFIGKIRIALFVLDVFQICGKVVSFISTYIFVRTGNDLFAG
jgi:hypothetical protein